jgi:uncharacterized membrane protein
MDSIDIRRIVGVHFRSLGLAANHPWHWSNVFLHVVLPVTAGASAAAFGWPWSTVTGNVLTAVSIIAGLLLNLLVLVHSMHAKLAAEGESERPRRVAKEAHANIAFATLVSLILVALLLTLSSIEYRSEDAAAVIRFPTDMLLFSLFVTLILVLRRVHALFEYDLA